MLQASPSSSDTVYGSSTPGVRTRSSSSGRHDSVGQATPAYRVDSVREDVEYDKTVKVSNGRQSSPHKAPMRKMQATRYWKSLNTDSRQLLAYLGLNIIYLCTEFVYGVVSGRLALVSDAFHLGFGSSVILTSLLATHTSRQPPDETFSYGYHRVEVLAAFTNCCFLLFMSFSLCVEALHTLIEAEEDHKHYLAASAIANLLVNLVGVSMFRKYARRQLVYQSAQDMNLHGIFLNVASDSLRSGGVILQLYLLSLGVQYAEALVNVAVAGCILFITIPLWNATASVLLQATPEDVSRALLQKCLQEGSLCEGVRELREVKFWSLQPGQVVGSLIVAIEPGTPEQKVLRHIHSVFDHHIGVADLTVQVEAR